MAVLRVESVRGAVVFLLLALQRRRGRRRWACSGFQAKCPGESLQRSSAPTGVRRWFLDWASPPSSWSPKRKAASRTASSWLYSLSSAAIRRLRVYCSRLRTKLADQPAHFRNQSWQGGKAGQRTRYATQSRASARALGATRRMRCAIVMLATAVRALRAPVTCARRHAPRRAAAAVAEVQAEANPFSIVRDDLKLMKLRIKALVENTLDEPGRGGGA